MQHRLGLTYLFIAFSLIVGSSFLACKSSQGTIRDVSEKRREELAYIDNLVKEAVVANDESALRRADEMLTDMEQVLDEDLTDARGEYDALAAIVGPLSAEFTQLQTAHDNLQAALPGLRASVAPLRAERDQLAATNTTLQQQIAALQAERTSLITQLKELTYRYRPYGFGVGGPLIPAVFPANAWHYDWGVIPTERDPRQIQMIWGGPPCARKTSGCRGYVDPGTCTAEQIDEWAKSQAQMIRSNPHLRGLNWLIFNEPDNHCQAYLDPTEAAWAWNALHHYLKQEDPSARLYCCGTQAGWHHSDNPGALHHYYLLRANQASSCGSELNADCWMKQFAQTLAADRMPDGLHYHNYYSEPDYGGFYNTQATIQVMRDYHTTIKNIVASRPALATLGQLEIIITEWAALSDNINDQVSGGNNWANVMHPVAYFLNRDGASINHVGAAWFISMLTQFDGHGADGSELYSDDLNKITPLGELYKSFVWQQTP